MVCEGKIRAAGVRLGPSPGLVIRIRRAGLDSFFDSVASLSSTYAHKCPIPDATAEVSGVNLQTTNVRITKFPKPQIRYRFTEPNGVAGSLEFPHVGIEGPFTATRKTLFATQSDGGRVIFNATGAVVNFTLTFDEFDNGIPRVQNCECASSLGPANLNVREAKEKFAIEVMGLAAKSVRPVYNSQVCPTIKKMMTSQVNRFLGQIPNVIDVSSSISIKFQVKPVFKQDYMETRLYGKCITDIVSPFNPAAFVESENTESMVAVFISDAVFNDVLYQAYNNQKLQFKVDKNSQPIMYDLVRVNCGEGQDACLGNVAPDLKEKFGLDATVRAEFRATKAPEVEFQQGKAVFTAALSADLYLTTANDSKEYHEATSTVDISGTFQVRIQDGTLYGKVSIDKVTVHIDEEHNKKWEDRIGETIKKIVDNYINGDLLLKGVPLKLPFGAGLTEPFVSFQPHTCQIHTGFEYTAVASAERK
jgi:hypothetical protein